MHDEVFVDGITEITVTGPTVRIDTFTASPFEKDADGNPKPVHRQRIIMTLESFMNARDLIDRVGRELVQHGAVRRLEAAPAKDTPKPAGSPNFPSSH
ncbi:MAG: hypothetical protein ROZ64_15935 [Burkholderiaceae bacterium]|jgi:hypothetical protein|nr:hypothetical protein [Burkholderiaceae bacterium]